MLLNHRKNRKLLFEYPPANLQLHTTELLYFFRPFERWSNVANDKTCYFMFLDQKIFEYHSLLIIFIQLLNYTQVPIKKRKCALCGDYDHEPSLADINIKTA